MKTETQRNLNLNLLIKMKDLESIKNGTKTDSLQKQELTNQYMNVKENGLNFIKMEAKKLKRNSLMEITN